MDVKHELSDMDKMGIAKHVKVFLLYELQPSVNQDQLVSSMKEGVRNATSQLPIMAGRLQSDAAGKPYIVTEPGSQVEVSIRQLEPQEHKPLSELAKDAYAPNSLDPTRLLPSEEELAAKNPVCTLQLSFIEGGLILGFRMNHGVGDWVSMDRFLSLVCQSSKAWHEGILMPAYTPDLNRTPYNAPTMDASISRQERLANLPAFHIIEKSQFKPTMPPPFHSSIYKISEQETQQIKTQCGPYSDGVEYISSYDCISALLWTSITRARIQLHPEKANSETRFVHPIDVRTRDPENKTSAEYFGNAVIGSQAGPLPASELVAEGDRRRGLATAASLVRQSISSVSVSTISHMTSLLTSLPPTEMLLPQANFTDMDMFMNTWYSGNADKYILGAGSVPVAFRVHSPMSGSCVILPNFSRGSTRVFDVCLQLTADEHELLRKDAEFRRYFEVVA